MKKFNKFWCLHCEKVSNIETEENLSSLHDYSCPYCGANCLDIEQLNSTARSGFFKQAYSNMDYKDIEIGEHYPLYFNK